MGEASRGMKTLEAFERIEVTEQCVLTPRVKWVHSLALDLKTSILGLLRQSREYLRENEGLPPFFSLSPTFSILYRIMEHNGLR